MNFEAVDITILGPAMMAGLLVIATHVPLGRRVLQRGIIFIDLAIAQIAGLGVIAADAFGWEAEGANWKIQIAAVSAALLGALLLNWTEKRFASIQEALIGILFVLGATLGLLLLANNPHGGEHIKELLVGQILWVSYSQLWPVLILYIGVLLIWFFKNMESMGRIGFYLLFAITITASVQLVGVYLVFASLIIPALATRNQSSNKQLYYAYAVGILGYLSGLIASALFDLPSGAIIVWCLALFGIIASLLIKDQRQPH
ncbi:MAG: metal ABC transporter permease [Enterobacterales bacterium]|nr:metal ABC transporter permease [Enterobacterales bacterium]